MIIKEILDEKALNGKCGVYAEVTLEHGCSLGYHEHHNESETYYILSGEGEYNDNGNLCPVKAGDVTFTPDGCGHGLRNTGLEDLVFMALIKIILRKGSHRKNIPYAILFYNYIFHNYNDKLYFRNRQEITPARHKPNNALCMEPNTSSAPFNPIKISWISGIHSLTKKEA